MVAWDDVNKNNDPESNVTEPADSVILNPIFENLNTQNRSDVAEEYWSVGLSPNANIKRFKAIRAGLLINLNESISDLSEAVKSNNVKEVQYYLRKLNDKWNRLESLQKSIVQMLSDDDLEILVEEARLFEDNRDVVDRQRELAMNFLSKAIELSEKETTIEPLKFRQPRNHPENFLLTKMERKGLLVKHQQ